MREHCPNSKNDQMLYLADMNDLCLFPISGLVSLCWRRQWHPTPVLLPGKSHGWRSLVGCSPWGREESDTTERLHFHFSLSCIGEGNGNLLQCSCLENPRDGGAWLAAVYGVAQSWARLKQLSSSSSIWDNELVFIFSVNMSSSEKDISNNRNISFVLFWLLIAAYLNSLYDFFRV